MLLIGSRALRFHFPEFRKPVDWDLIGTQADVERFDAALPRADEGRRKPGKAHYRYGEALVELATIEQSPYWTHVMEVFQDSPTISDAVLGDMRVPPASYLMITKQCGLIYRIGFWHKNLRDLYFLRNLIPEIPDKVAQLLPLAQQNSADMFEARHIKIATESFACHHHLPPHPQPDLHARLHDQFKLGTRPLREEYPNAWRAFPGEEGSRRTELMVQLLAEEAMVLAAHHYVLTDLTREPRTTDELKKFAIRALIVSGLPKSWRYFGVNHYREISDLIPSNWGDELNLLDSLRARSPETCTDEVFPSIEAVDTYAEAR